MAGIVIIAHASLAQTLLSCAEHIYEHPLERVLTYDICPDVEPTDMVKTICQALDTIIKQNSAVLLTDICGATPANIAAQVSRQRGLPLIAGINLPMLLRTIAYRTRPSEVLVQAALAGGAQGVMRII